jgi:hypothetical protein
MNSINDNSKSEKFYQAIGQISDDKITEANSDIIVRRVSMWKIAAPMAATLAIIVAAAIFVLPLLGEDSGNTADPASSDNSETPNTLVEEPPLTDPDHVPVYPLTLNRASGFIYEDICTSELFAAFPNRAELFAAFPAFESFFDLGNSVVWYRDGELYAVLANFTRPDGSNDAAQIKVLHGTATLMFGDNEPVVSTVHGIPVIAGVQTHIDSGSAIFAATFTIDGIDYSVKFGENEPQSLEHNQWLEVLVNAIIWNTTVDGLRADLSVLADPDNFATHDPQDPEPGDVTDYGDILSISESAARATALAKFAEVLSGDERSIAVVKEIELTVRAGVLIYDVQLGFNRDDGAFYRVFINAQTGDVINAFDIRGDERNVQLTSDAVVIRNGGRDHAVVQNWNHGSFDPHRDCPRPEPNRCYGFSASGMGLSACRIEGAMTPIRLSRDFSVNFATEPDLRGGRGVMFSLYDEFFNAVYEWSDTFIAPTAPGTYYLAIYASWTTADYDRECCSGDSWNSFDFWAAITV